MSDDYISSITPEDTIQMADDFIKTASNPQSAMEGIVGLLKASYSYYDWVGIYLMVDDKTLKLGPFRGDPSPHTVIPIDEGICGAAALEKQTIIVPDVKADPRFLACSIKTRSEIVVPIKRGDLVLGEIDIDSDLPNAFGLKDQNMLEAIANSLAEIM
jgi:putative methionine-R-sulfoxide reductase with GAF domain